MAVLSAQGGASEFVHHSPGGNAAPGALGTGGSVQPYQAKVFQVMSNELSTPKVVYCPADSFHTTFATNFGTFGSGGTPAGDFNTNKMSFFIGTDAGETDPQQVLFGDDNIGTTTTQGAPAPGRIVVAQTLGNGNFLAQNLAWTIDTHNKVGNIALSDGSVQQLSVANLRTTAQNGTNTVIYPVYELGY
jgi:hypothetical protein